MNDRINHLRRGQRFTATQIVVRNGGRIISERRIFTALWDHDIEVVPTRDYPTQARVRARRGTEPFVDTSSFLVVLDSIILRPGLHHHPGRGRPVSGIEADQ